MNTGFPNSSDQSHSIVTNAKSFETRVNNVRENGKERLNEL